MTPVTHVHCEVCADDAAVMLVLGPASMDALCEDNCGRRHTVPVDLIGPVSIGERVLVHAGVAIGRMP
jgi:hydrogenase maturation factor